jgi:flagellar FliJ protein
MKKFRFRLQKVMELKEEIEKQRKLELSEARRHLMDEKQKLEEMETHNKDCWNTVERIETADRVNPWELVCAHRYMHKLEEEMMWQSGKVLEVEAAFDEKRIKLLEASKERKMLEKLKEKRFSTYRTDADRKEQKILDEFAAMQFTRHRGGKS